MKKRLLLVVVLLLISATSVSAQTTGGGVLKKFKFVTAGPSGVSKSSTFFEPIPDMSLSFNTNRTGPMVITFSGLAKAESGTAMQVLAEVDGVQAEPIFPVAFAVDPLAAAKTMTWVAPDVPVGPHTVEIRWKSVTLGKTVTIFHRTLIAQFKR